MTTRCTVHIFSFLILLFLCSCEGETTYSKKIVNQSADTLFFKIYSNYPGMIADSMCLLPGQEVLFYQFSKLGGTDHDIDCTDGIDSLISIVSDGKILVKDYMDPGNWNYSRTSNRRGSFVNNYCEFVVRDDDLQ